MKGSIDMSTNEAAAVGGILGASLMMIALIGIAMFVLTVIARWKIFTKAGEEGWKSIIPIYSDYVEWKLSWNNITMFWISLALIIGGSILNVASGSLVVSAAYTESGSAAAAGGGGFLGILASLLTIAGCVIMLIQKFKLFKAFGKGAGWFVAWIFFNNIMVLVLGFGSAQYEGPQD